MPDTDLIELIRSPVGLVFVLLLGLICGSFVTALSYRLPRGENFVSGRSACPSCKTTLTGRDLFPVLSWVLSKGQCRHCKTKVSGRYPLIELTCAVLFMAVIVWGDPLSWGRILALWGLAIGLLALTVTDFEFHRLPNSLVLFVFALTSVLAGLDGLSAINAGASIAIAVCVGLALRGMGQLIEKKPGLGWGDIKLLAALSVPLTIDLAPYFLILTALSSLALTAWYVWIRGQTRLPFGPALCLAGFATFL